MKTGKLLRAPLLHFLLLGGGLFALQAAFSQPGSPASSSDRVVAVSAAEVERLAKRARSESGRPPSPADLENRIREWVDEEILFREARALGWSHSDPVVQRRLIQNMRFLGDQTGGEPAALLAQAYALGLDRSDLVVRRRLVERMKLAITAAARRAEPDDAELEALLRREPERFRREARVRLTQLYLSRDRHRAELGAAARALLAELVAQELPPEAAVGRGDPFLLPARLPLWSARALAARLGPEFARRVFELPLRRWAGPVPSSYGLHLVWVHERAPGATPPLAEVRRELRAAWLAERERRTLRRALDELRRDLEVRIEPT
jgi:parvulin-like peptidyl-prolyl isomerase